MAAVEAPPAAALQAKAALLGGYTQHPMLLVLCGPQGAGKSFFCAALLRAAPAWVHVSQDTISNGKPGPREKVERAARAALADGRSVVVDRMHLDRDQRAHFVSVARARTRQTSVLLDGLAYANGVALSADESWVAVVETSLARVQRHWLRGPRAGQTEVLVDRLPGLPDGISRSPDGGFWVGLVVPLSPLPKLFGPYRPARQLLSHLISRLYPLLSKRWGAVLKLDAEGRPVRALFDTDVAVVVAAAAERAAAVVAAAAGCRRRRGVAEARRQLGLPPHGRQGGARVTKE